MKAQITTPIYYPNAKPHLGHAYTTIAADALARWLRLRGEDVRLVTGTDEHAEKIAKAAAAAGESPEDFVVRMRAPFKEMMERVGVDMHPDRFAFRATHEERHIEDVRRFFGRLKERDEVYKGVYKGWYNVRESAFVPQKAAEAAGFKDTLTGDALEEMEEPAWFFRMKNWAPRVAAHIRANPGFVRPAGRQNEVLSRLDGEVEDLCVSRPRARHDWGVALPHDEEFVVYVWFDALITYLTGAGWEHEPDWEERWRNTLHILGKDILWFHAGVWPALLLAAGLPLPGGMFVHGYLTVGGEKMSKSIGNVIDPLAVGERFGPFGGEVVRFFCLHEVPFGGDAAVASEQFAQTYNAYLANELGNLLHRAGSMIDRWLGGAVPSLGRLAADQRDEAYLRLRDQEALHGFDEAMRTQVAIRDAIRRGWALVKWGHGYIDAQKPWDLAKAGDSDGLMRVFAHVADALAVAAILLDPILPGASSAIHEALGAAPMPVAAVGAADFEDLFGLTPGHTRAMSAGVLPLFDPPAGTLLALPPQLFPRLEAAATEAKEEEGRVSDQISIDEFAKVRLVVGEVTAARSHPDADRLLLLEVDLGGEDQRQVVAGIAGAYAPEDLVGRQVVVAANLKPATLRGEVSQGMVLAAAGDAPVLLAPDAHVPAGTKIK